jgi:hypothetical protein
MLNGKVETWQMTEEQRLEYIRLHPIKPSNPDKKELQLKDLGRKKRKGRVQ